MSKPQPGVTIHEAIKSYFESNDAPDTSKQGWRERVKEVWDHWIANYLWADDAFDLELRESVAWDEVSQAIQQEIDRAVEVERERCLRIIKKDTKELLTGATLRELAIKFYGQLDIILLKIEKGDHE